ncbi:DNA helicase RecG, partial [Priestia megaterium]
IEPVYSVKGSLTVKGMRKFVSLALKNYGSSIQDMLPASIRSRYKLVTREEAVRSIHLPRDHEDLKQARRRFVYEEFLLFQLKMQALRKREREETPGMKQVFDSTELVNFTNLLPFPLTNAQKRVVNEITHD